MSFRPSPVFTPFLRRFTDEAARDLSDTRRLYDRVRGLHRTSPLGLPDVRERIHSVLAKDIRTQCTLPDYEPLLEAFDRLIDELLQAESVLFSMPEIAWGVDALSMQEHVDLRHFLRAKEHALGNYERTIDTLGGAIGGAIIGFVGELPPLSQSESPAFRFALTALVPDIGGLVERLSGIFLKDEVVALGLCRSLQERLYENACRASGILPDKETSKSIVTASESELPPEELVAAYLSGTPLARLFDVTVPFSIPNHIRFEHTHILGGSGHGKTTLLTQQLLSDLSEDTSPALIIIDGKGTFVEEVQRFALFAPGQPLSDKLVILDPRDIEHPPALNMFAAIDTRGNVPPHVRLQIQEETINSFSYVFGASDFAMTEKQETCLSYAARILFKMPEPTLQTLLDIMSDPLADAKLGGVRPTSPFKPYIEQLDPHHRDFIQGLFYHPTEYTETKRQLRNRIYSLLKHPSFAAMFLTKERRLDLFDIIQNRKILLVNASPAAIGETGAQLLGRYIIAQALTSAYGRLAVQKSQWAAAHLIVDEAQMFIDEDKTQPLLQQAREFNLGVTLAHQKLADLTPKLIATVAANTSIRYVGGVSAADASFMAKNMNCEAEFIMGQRKSASETHFATYVRGYTERAVILSVPLGVLGKQPKMSAGQFDALMARNRALIGATRPVQPAQRPEPSPTQPAPKAAPTGHSEGDTHTGSTSTW